MSWSSLKLSTNLVKAVCSLRFKQPTSIQEQVVPLLKEGKHAIYSSETGSGKTMAYLIPLVERLVEDEQSGFNMAKPGRPRALILCPTRELAQQVLEDAKELSHFARFSSSLLVGGFKGKKRSHNALKRPVDLFVSTPNAVLEMKENGRLSTSKLQVRVLWSSPLYPL